jgi:antitoxin component HigA of HigAB toxin-antitoxin module
MIEPFDLEKLLKKGVITSELEYERAMEAFKILRILGAEKPKFLVSREKLFDILENYEKQEWSHVDLITDLQVIESDAAEEFVAKERAFFQKRKKKIKLRLKALNLTQGDLTTILGHRSKTYISELMNGLSPFTLRDLVILHHFLSIEMKDLVPTFLNLQDRNRLREISIALKV